MSTRSLIGLVAAFTTSCGGAATTAPGPSTGARAPAGDTEIAARFGAELGCMGDALDPLRAWCPVARIGVFPFVPPDTATTLFGISQPIRPGAKIRDTLLGPGMRISTLTLDAQHAEIRDVKPETPEERAILVDLAGRIADELDHHRGELHVSAALDGFAAQQRANAGSGHVFTVDGDAARYVAKAPTRVYTLDRAYVAIEEESDGVWVSVYPTATLRGDK